MKPDDMGGSSGYVRLVGVQCSAERRIPENGRFSVKNGDGFVSDLCG